MAPERPQFLSPVIGREAKLPLDRLNQSLVLLVDQQVRLRMVVCLFMVSLDFNVVLDLENTTHANESTSNVCLEQ